MSDLALDALVADANGAKLLEPEVLVNAPELIVLADQAEALHGAFETLRFGDLAGFDPCAEPIAFPLDRPVYVIFTSGTTGSPEGVVISYAQLKAYLSETRGWTQLGPSDLVV